MNAIKKYRELLGMTQEMLAERCGVVKSAVSMWETGERKPSIVTVKLLAGLFGCTTDELLADVEGNAKGGTQDDAG